jgi:hypothetical protein
LCALLLPAQSNDELQSRLSCHGSEKRLALDDMSKKSVNETWFGRSKSEVREKSSLRDLVRTTQARSLLGLDSVREKSGACRV